MKIKTMLFSAAALTALSTVVLSAVSYTSSSAIVRDADTIIHDGLLEPFDANLKSVRKVDEAVRLLLNADRDAYQVLEAELKCLLESDAERIDAYAADGDANISQVRDRAHRAFAVIGDSSAKSRFDAAYTAWASATRDAFTACAAGETARVADPAAVASRVELFNGMRNLIDEVSSGLEVQAETALANIAQVTEQAHTEATAMEERADGRKLVVMSVGAGSVIAVIAVMVPLTLVITRRITTIATAMQSVASGRADLTLRVNDQGSDEMALLGRLFDAVVERFEQVVINIQDASMEMNNESQAIEQRAAEVNDRLQHQAGGLRQTSAAVTQLAASVDEVAKRCRAVAETAGRSRELSVTGGGVVRETVDSMRAIAETFEDSGRSVRELGQSVERIGSIIDVINDIAEQTNLLALNAAIEAARAGEHGRGFAVVADEVRKLADRTTEATDEIATSIRSIQTETDGAVVKIDMGTGQVRSGTEQASHAGTALVEIEAAIREVATMVYSFAATTDEQANATGEINRETEEIAVASNAITDSMNGTVSNIRAVRNASNRLGELVLQYNTSRSG